MMSSMYREKLEFGKAIYWLEKELNGREYRILRNLKKLVSIRHTLIILQMKAVEKHRINGKKIKWYDIDTPLNRIL